MIWYLILSERSILINLVDTPNYFILAQFLVFGLVASVVFYKVI
jgi:hypothetical protein